MFFSRNVAERICCRETPSSKQKCPVTAADLKDLYNGLVKHGESKKDFWTGRGPQKAQYNQYIEKARARLQNHLKTPFQVAGVEPLTLTGWNLVGEKDPADVVIHYRFTQEELDEYKRLNDKSKEFMVTCSSKDGRQNLLSLLALDHRYLIICDQLPTHRKEPIQPGIESAATAALLRDGTDDDDRSVDDNNPADQANGRGATPPTPVTKDQSRDGDFRKWMPNRPHAIPWNDLGFSAPDAPDRKNFLPACAFFFFIPELAARYVDVNNALHRHWLSKFKDPMKAADFDAGPLGFEDDEVEWLKANIELMVEKLSDDERAERGLPVSAGGGGRPKAAAAAGTARTKASAIAKEAARKEAAEKQAPTKPGKERQVAGACNPHPACCARGAHTASQPTPHPPRITCMGLSGRQTSQKRLRRD